MGYQILKQTTESNPASGNVSIYVKTSTGDFRWRDSSGSEYPGGTVSYTTSSKTADYTITYTDCDGKTIIDNTGASSTIKFTLPSVNDLATPNIQGSKVILRNTSSTLYLKVETIDRVKINAVNVKYFQVILKPGQTGYFEMWDYEWHITNNIEVEYGILGINRLINKLGTDTIPPVNMGYIDVNGVGWLWGDNTNGQLGDGTTTFRNTPVSVCGNHTFCQITMGKYHSLGLKADGSLWAWGLNTSGQLGDGTVTQRNTPVSVCGNHTFSTIFASINVSYGIKADGSGWAWGANASAQLGDNTVTARCTPVAICGNLSFKAIVHNSINQVNALTTDNKLWSWGDISNNANGFYASGTNYVYPIRIHPNCSFATIAKGPHSSGTIFTLKADGSAWGWGLNGFGQLGDNSVTYRSTPVAVCGGHTFCQISVGYEHTLALKADGSAWAWGGNPNGQLGDNTIVSKITPVAVCGGHTFCQIITGRYHNLGLKADGSVWGWGLNNFGQLGDNTAVSKLTPVSVLGGHTFCQVFAGVASSYGLKSDGSAWSWGYNGAGELGDNTIVDKSTPIQVCGGHAFSRLAVGYEHVIALKTDGSAWAWGLNISGQLGDNSTTQRNTPVSVCGGLTFDILFAGAHGDGISFGVKNGKVWGWGFNTSGQLADGTITHRCTPVAICGDFSFCQINTVYTNTTITTYGLDANGNVFIWGRPNTTGTLGLPSSNTVSSPVIGALPNKTFNQIDTGLNSTLAVATDGTMYMWGTTYSTYTRRRDVASQLPSVICDYGIKPRVIAFNNYQVFADGKETWSWGYNAGRNLLNPLQKCRSAVIVYQSPTQKNDIVNSVTICQIVGYGDTTTLDNGAVWALDSNKKLWYWGTEFGTNKTFLDNSAIFAGASRIVATPRQMTIQRGLSACTLAIQQFAATIENSGYILNGNNIYNWGDVSLFQNGNQFRTCSVSVINNQLNQAFNRFVSNACDVKTQQAGTTILLNDGRVLVNGQGSDGISTVGGTLSVNNVITAHSFVKIAVTQFSNGNTGKFGGLKADGSLWMWGSNGQGQMGDGTIVDKATPASVCGNHTFCQISIKENHILALKADGSLWTWGFNGSGQLGDNTIVNKCTPVAVCGGHTFCQISNGSNFSVALKSDGSAWAWGNNQFATLGDNTTVSKLTPITVCGGHTFCQISCGYYHVLALKSDGSAWGWGRNDFGQLGNNTLTASFLTPVAVCGGHTFCQIFANFKTSFAIKADGSVFSWGNNDFNILGQNIESFADSPLLAVL